jgi:hypothetical protein
MSLQKEYVRYLSKRIVEELLKREMVAVENTAELQARVLAVIDAEVSLEDQINEEVRSILKDYSEEMNRTGVAYHEMFKIVKNKLVKDKKVILWRMRLSREKVNRLAHLVTEDLAANDEIEFIEDRNTIRLEIVKIINEELKKEETLDREARKKIESQKKTVPEGSLEWDILYRKYYSEELKKL